MNKGYEDLNVWVKAKNLAVAIYGITKLFPKEELFGLTSQIRRSAVSIASNIAEGCERNTKGEFMQFLGIAAGSLGELHTQIIISREIGFIEEIAFNETIQEIRSTGRMINGLISSLKKPTAKLATGNQ